MSHRDPIRPAADDDGVHEALLATLIIVAFSLGVLAFYFLVLFALGQTKGIF